MALQSFAGSWTFGAVAGRSLLRRSPNRAVDAGVVMKENGCAAVKWRAARHGVHVRIPDGADSSVATWIDAQREHPRGYGARGRGEEEATKILSDARVIADAGAFVIVLEGVMEELATRVAREIEVPIIGIGASAECDGQILVTDDMLGLFERTPRFVKRYDNLAQQIGKAAGTYAEEVRSRAFPSLSSLQDKGRLSLAFST